MWLQRRIADVGTPFIRALLKYIKEHILKPLAQADALKKPPAAATTAQAAAAHEESIEQQKQKQVILDKSHLSKEKLAMTIENL